MITNSHLSGQVISSFLRRTNFHYSLLLYVYGDRGSTAVKVLCYKSEGRCFDPSLSLEFFIDIKSFRSHYGPVVDAASNRNEYQEHFVEVKAAGAYGWQPYHHPVPLSWNLGTLNSWNTLGHSRPVTGLLYSTYGLYVWPTSSYVIWFKCII